jgi:hypothetical protein
MDIIEEVDDKTRSRMLWNPIIGDFTISLGRHLVRSDQIESQEAYGRVAEEAARILGQCVPPKAEDATRTGLVIGYVQSGKTMSMATISTLARDNGFKLIIAISGTTDNLFKQSYERFVRDLRGSESRPAQWVILKNPSAKHDARTLQDKLGEWQHSGTKEERKQGLFIVVMKNHARLRELAKFLRTQNLSGINALILDDEADQAGLNTRPESSEASTTYLRLKEIRGNLPKHTFLQYTATAQSIILISLLDMLSPDFADVLEPGADYTGGKSFLALLDSEWVISG